MSSAASAAGYMATSGLVNSIPALYMTTGRVLVWWEMMAWLGALSMLGVVIIFAEQAPRLFDKFL